jgi:heat shock protein HslJ
MIKISLFTFTILSLPASSENTINITLSDTQWHLLEFQSMDDTQGIKQTDDPSKYTMYLHSDGTVTMKLNCNFAKGTWSAKAGQDLSSGSFEFGHFSMTKALCPPPSMDEHISVQAKYIRSYLLKNEKLYLSLMADGGIYVWEPHNEATSQLKADKRLETAILSVSPDYLKQIENYDSGIRKARYVYERVDLNGDGHDEVLVYLMGPFFCGTGGCNLLLFTDTKNGYSLINEFSTTRIPVIVSAKKSNGWNNLIWLKSGGGYPSSYVSHIYNGKRYMKSKSMPADIVPAGQSHLSGDITFDDGIPLELQN